MAVTAMLFSGVLMASPVTVTLTPDADLFGSPDQVVGWGFDLTNSTGNYLVVDSAFFAETSVPVGVSSDLISSVFHVVAPGEEYRCLFNGTEGLMAYHITSRTIGSSSSGTIRVSYTLYSDADAIVFVGSGTANAAPEGSVTVTPELSTAALLSLGLAALSFTSRQRWSLRQP